MIVLLKGFSILKLDDYKVQIIEATKVFNYYIKGY